MLVAGLFGIIWAPVWGACVRCFGVVSGVGVCGDVWWGVGDLWAGLLAGLKTMKLFLESSISSFLIN